MYVLKLLAEKEQPLKYYTTFLASFCHLRNFDIMHVNTNKIRIHILTFWYILPFYYPFSSLLYQVTKIAIIFNIASIYAMKIYCTTYYRTTY